MSSVLYTSPGSLRSCPVLQRTRRLRGKLPEVRQFVSGKAALMVPAQLAGSPAWLRAHRPSPQPARPKCCPSWGRSGQVLLVGPRDEPQSPCPRFCPPPGSGLKGLGGPQPLPPGGQADSLLPSGRSRVGGRPGTGLVNIRAGGGQQLGRGGRQTAPTWGASWRGPGVPLEAFPVPWFTTYEVSYWGQS